MCHQVNIADDYSSVLLVFLLVHYLNINLISICKYILGTNYQKKIICISGLTAFEY